MAARARSRHRSQSMSRQQQAMRETGWSTNMQRLVVHALVMRQLGRLNPQHLVAAGYGLRHTEWCPRTIHTRQLWGCSVAPAHTHRPSFSSRDTLRSWAAHHLRFKSSKKKGFSRTGQVEEEEEDEEIDPEDSDYEEAMEDPNVPKDYKDMEKHVQSFRFDIVMKAGLDMARNKIEDAFYGNKLRLNGQKLIKKSKMVKVGDTLDLVLEENRETNTVILMRVVLRKVFSEASSTDRQKVALRRWKSLEISKTEAFKS